MGVEHHSIVRGFAGRQVRSKVVRNAQGHGTAKVLSDDEIYEKFMMDFKAVSTFLGDKPYFMGERVSSYDATVFGHLAILAQGQWNHQINKTVRQCTNVMNYLERMRNEFWPELQMK